MKNRLRDKPWYNYAVAMCIAVILYVVIAHLNTLVAALGVFAGFFKPVILGCVIAYIIMPLQNWIERKVLRNMKPGKGRMYAAEAIAIVGVLVFLLAAFAVLIPQLVSSVTNFADNLDSYIAALTDFLNSHGIGMSQSGLEDMLESPDGPLAKVQNIMSGNLKGLLSVASGVGSSMLNWGLGLIIAIYMLAEKDLIKSGIKELLKAMFSEEHYKGASKFLKKCHKILKTYIVFNLLDAMVVGLVNMVFMLIFRMPYVGLVSFTVALFNLIPTFGPVIGAVIGAFILILVKPWYAIAFLLFTCILQVFDGYILKPKLFGGSLGISGLWVLVAIIVGGNMFGVVGILLSIPTIAILFEIYHGYLIPTMIKYKEKDPEDG